MVNSKEKFWGTITSGLGFLSWFFLAVFLHRVVWFGGSAGQLEEGYDQYGYPCVLRFYQVVQ